MAGYSRGTVVYVYLISSWILVPVHLVQPVLLRVPLLVRLAVARRVRRDRYHLVRPFHRRRRHARRVRRDHDLARWCSPEQPFSRPLRSGLA